MSTDQEFNVNDELNKQIKTDRTEETQGSIKKALKGMFNVGEANDIIDADSAYLRVQYKEYTSRKKLFAAMLYDIKQRIKTRVEANTLYTLVEIQPEMMDYAEDVANALRKYGYQVWILDKEVLTNLQPDTPVNRTTMFMLIMWDKVY